MRILIADDERLVRLSIRSMIEELGEKGLIERALIEEVQNGLELESALQTFCPHLAFVDIKMPIKSGLEVIEHAGVADTRAFWVLLTGYAEFSFAKRAIEMGVLDYLVKPASPDDILKVIQQTGKRVQMQVNTETLTLAGKLGSLFRKTTDQEFDQFFSMRYFLGGVILCREEANPKEERASGTTQRERRIIRELTGHLTSSLERISFSHYPFNICSAVVFSENGNLVVALSFLSDLVDEIKDIGQHLESLITHILESSSCEGSRWLYLPLMQPCDAEHFVRSVAECEQVSTVRMGQTEEIEGKGGQSAKRKEQVEKALEIVHTVYKSDIGLAQVADELGLSPNYLSSEFKTYTGVNFTDYITRLRMDSACELLKISGMSVKKTASELGYTSWRYFSKLFCQTYGIKPSEYIEKHRWGAHRGG
ncbi:MAG: helix-turn-helix domain-containing protein [Sphaerochaetaceae bacterium]|nr:helix-turn-helix domain-containing protein [Sphaerochaetaceae bacterium]